MTDQTPALRTSDRATIPELVEMARPTVDVTTLQMPDGLAPLTQAEADILSQPLAKARTKFTPEKETRFLVFLAHTGQMARSAFAVGVSYGAIARRRDEDPDFDAAVIEAQQIYAERVSAEVQRRAIEGWDEPVFYQGAVVAHIRRYSDRMLELEAKRRCPEYRERVAVDATVKAGIIVVGAVAPTIDALRKELGEPIDVPFEPSAPPPGPGGKTS